MGVSEKDEIEERVTGRNGVSMGGGWKGKSAKIIVF
jgi:hypothetical protein